MIFFGIDLSRIFINHLLIGRLLYILHIVMFIIFIRLFSSFYKRYIRGILNNKEKLLLAGAIVLFIFASLSISQFRSVIFFDEQQYISGSMYMINHLGFFNCMSGTADQCTLLWTIPHGMAYSFFGSFLSIFAGGNISIFEYIIKSLNLLFSALSIIAFYFLIKAMFGRRRFSKLATILFATCPVMLAFSSTALTEPSTQFFFVLSAWIAYILYTKMKEDGEEKKKLSLLLITTLFFAFSNRGEMIILILPFLFLFLTSIKQAKQIIIALAAYALIIFSHVLNYAGKPALHSFSSLGGIYLRYWLSVNILPLTLVTAAISLIVLIILAKKKEKLLYIEGDENSLRFLVCLLFIFILSILMFSSNPFKEEHRFLIPVSFVPYLILGVVSLKGKIRLVPTAVLLVIVAAMTFSQVSYAKEIINLPYYENVCNNKQMDAIKMLDSLNESEYSYSYPLSYLATAFSHKTELREEVAMEQGNISFYAVNTVFNPDLIYNIPADEKVLILEENLCGINISLIRR